MIGRLAFARLITAVAASLLLGAVPASGQT